MRDTKRKRTTRPAVGNEADETREAKHPHIVGARKAVENAIALESGRTGRMQRQSRCEPGYDERERSAYERIARSFKPGKRSQERRMRIFKWKKLVSLILVGVFCGSAVSASAFADDDGKDQPPAKPAAAKIEAPAPLTERERQLLDRVEQLEKRMAELEGKAQPTDAPAPASSDSSAVSTESAVAGPAAAPSAVSAEPASSRVTDVATAVRVQPQAMEKTATGTVKPEKAQPFAFADFTWLNGNPRTKEVPLDTKFFTPEIRADVDYVYDFAHPKDDTIGGSSEIFRSNEVHVTQMGVGGDFHYDNVRARIMTQFGLYSQTTPRNDASPSRGQWNLADAYRYLSEAYGGYHFNVLHGVNLDAGIFMSYVGLFSYYQFDNFGPTSRRTFLRTHRGSLMACALKYSPQSI